MPKQTKLQLRIVLCINDLSLPVNLCSTGCNITNKPYFAHTFVDVFQQTPIISLNSFNVLFFVMEAHRVLCEVGTQYV